jgi:hypothetical protein
VNTLPDNTHFCPECNGTGNTCGYHVPDDATMPQLCPECKGRGYVFDTTVQPVRDIIIVTLPASAEDTLQELRAMLWECRNFKPGAVALRIAVSDMLTAVQEAKEGVR